MIYSKQAIELLAERTQKTTDFWQQKFSEFDDDYGFVVKSDTDYPELFDSLGRPIDISFSKRTGLPNKKGAPEFLFYRGNISLLNNIQNNVSVVGLTEPSPDIVKREKKIVSELVGQGFNILSGLAKGCDTISHETCLACGGKTIAVLPSTLTKIIPSENSPLANKIVATGGLLLTEYFAEPESRWEAVGRFIERDRLQAFLSTAIVLVASYRHNNATALEKYPNDGIKRDSGSRHAMQAALSIGRPRLIMYDDSVSDQMNPELDLNRDLLYHSKVPAIQLTHEAIKSINMKKVVSPSQPQLF